MKEKDFNFPLPMELTNISVNYDTEFFIAIEDEKHPLHLHAVEVYLFNCSQAFQYAEPGFSFNFRKDNETLRNACTEVTSEDDSDKCNLGTVWINKIKTTKDLRHTMKYGTIFLICGGIYSDVPNEKIREVGNRNNRIGLGLGGIHEWLMTRGHGYECVPELHKWLAIYEEESSAAAFITARTLNVAVPKGVRAIAPTGTIGIIAETTTGIEPLFCKAYKRRYYKDGTWLSQYVVDGAVKRLLEQGVAQEAIQDSYDLDFKQRVKFQADVQNYVDMAISSTCNIPTWGSEENNEKTLDKYSKILLKYAKRLRGFTVYPDGCRGGQPLTKATLEEALAKEGTVFEEQMTECVGGVCGI
jgi:ribonucleoside-diphosphate reductase alpha chain